MGNNGYVAYKEAQACELDQSKLILMMFAGAINFLNRALEVSNTDIQESGKYVTKVKNIILELISSLNMDDSGEMGEILLKAYRGLFMKLNLAYVEDDLEKIAEVRDSLVELGESWKKVFESPEYETFKRNHKQSNKKQNIIIR